MAIETLAKLLAEENITVVTKNTSTASFDVLNRALTLPVYSHAEESVKKMMTTHEVGHALFTPLEGWHDTVVAEGKVFRGYLNVLEDARIERRIKAKYPGMIRHFTKAYQILLDEGFFGATTIAEINEKSFIDRINIHYKSGASAGVKFSEEEQPWLKRIDEAHSWEQLVKLTHEIFEFAKEQMENEQNQDEMDNTSTDGEGDRSGEGEDSNESESGSDEFGDESSDGTDIPGDSESESDSGELEDAINEDNNESGSEQEDDDAWGEKSESESDADETSGDSSDEQNDCSDMESGAESNSGDLEDEDEESLDEGEYEDDQSRESTDEVPEEESSAETSGAPNSGGDSFDEPGSDAPESETDANFRENEDKLTDTVSRVAHVQMPTQRLPIVTTEEFLNISKAAVTIYDTETELAKTNLFNKYWEENKATVQHMTREFVMKKSAEGFARNTVAKTGVIDTVKMNNYKFDDDIFKRLNVVHDEQNHGFIIYLDWSGSMSDIIYDTVKQLLNLVFFCESVNVPMQVFTFNSYVGIPNMPKVYRDNPQYDQSDYNEQQRIKENFNTVMTGENPIQGVPVPDPHTREFSGCNMVYLVELFSGNMSKQKIRAVAENLLMYSARYASYVYDRAARINYYRQWFRKESGANIDRVADIPRIFQLGGTPLNIAILDAVEVHHEFKSTHQVDIVNTVFLTDGESQKPRTILGMEDSNAYVQPGIDADDQDLLFLHSKKYNRNWEIRTKTNDEQTGRFLEIYKELTDSRVIGIRLQPEPKKIVRKKYISWTNDYLYVNEDGEKTWLSTNRAEFKKAGFFAVGADGYDRFFIVRSQTVINEDETEVETEELSKAKAKSKFTKSLTNKKVQRNLVERFMEFAA